MAKSILLTYLLWLLFGWFGLHHFYLRRDRHAFIWWATLGGCSGLGWFRDLWKIPEYVQDVNEDYDYMQMLTAKMRYGAPRFNLMRFLGKMIVGMTFATLVSSAFPEEIINAQSLTIVIPYAIALGVHVVGNIGRETSSLKAAVIGAYCGLPWMLKDVTYIGASILFSSLAAEFSGKGWKRAYGRRHWFKRLVTLILCCSLYSSLWCSSIYHNAYVHNKDGEKIKLKDAVQNFFNSPAWTETKEAMGKIYEYYQTHGWDKIWEELATQLDPEGEDHSYKVLGVSSYASEEEINKSYRKLVKQWHPDKVKDPTLKEEAAQKFMEIQKAYETVSHIKARRTSRNNKQRPKEH